MFSSTILSFILFLLRISSRASALSLESITKQMKRRPFFEHIILTSTLSLFGASSSASAFAVSKSRYSRGDALSASSMPTFNSNNDSEISVAYRSLLVDVPKFGVKVPVAMWYQKMTNDVKEGSKQKKYGITYSHRISVKKIGELLAGWNFIPEFASKDFHLTPTINEVDEIVVDGESVALPKSGPVVLLAHGYLGSRFDLSHLAEEFAREGFICLSPEYPESLASSYPRIEGLNRDEITMRVLDAIGSELAITPTSYGIIGHSLGCGTAMSTGDATWARVCIAGFPSTVDGPALFLTSVNDSLVSMSRIRDVISPDYVELKENSINANLEPKLPRKSFLIFDRPDAPNHISFLSDSTNNAMIDLLSPLLPLAQALKIPVLDFDKYKQSKDSKQTADIVIPLVTSFLKQNML